MLNKNFLFLLASMLLLNACSAGSSDPRSRSIFDYNPEAYEARIQEREDRLAAIEAQQAREREENTALKQAVGDKTLTIAEQQSELRKMQNNVAAMRRKLDSNANLSTAQREQASQLQGRLSQVQQEMQANANLQAKSLEERKAYLAQLKQEYESLQKDMDALLME